MKKTKPERILSLLPSSTEIVCALGLEHKLVGVTHECDFPEGVSAKPHVTASRISHETMTSGEIDHAVKSQLDGHGSIYDLDERLLKELAPDLILTQELCDVCAVNYKTVSKAARIHASDADVVSLEPTTINEIFGTIETVGKICGVEERAKELIADLNGRLDFLRKQTSKELNRPRVFMLEWLDPPFAPGHWVPEQVADAGGICILGEAGKKSLATTFERIIESKPEVMVLIPCGFYISDTERQLQGMDFDRRLADTPAAVDSNIWLLDATSYFSRPGPRVVKGAEILAKILHPEIFGEPATDEAVRIQADSLRFRTADAGH